MDATVGGVNATFLPRVDSQDAWIFRSPLKESVLALAGFEMGRPRYCPVRLDMNSPPIDALSMQNASGKHVRGLEATHVPCAGDEQQYLRE